MPRLGDRLDRKARSFHPSADAFDRVLERARRRERSRRIAAGVVAVGLFLVAALGIGLAISTGAPPPRPNHPGPSPAAPVHVPDHIGSLVWTGDALWGLGADTRRPVDHYLLRLGPSTGDVVASTVLPGAVMLAYADGSLWASTYEAGRLVEIDPSTGETLRSIPLGHLGQAPYLATDGTTVFVLVNGSIVRLDPGEDRPVELATVPSAGGLVFADGSLWVADADRGTVLRVDPATGGVVAEISGTAFGEAAGIAAGGGAVWAMGQTSLLKIDPATNTVVNEVAAGSPYAFAESPGAVWIADTAAVWKVDTRNDRSFRVFEGHAVGLAVVNDVLWVADATDRMIALPTCTPDCATTTGTSG